MRRCAGLFLGFFVVLNAAAFGQDKTADQARYSIAPDLKMYPQGTAKETLGSILKAIESKRIDYLTAQLADPSFVDERVKRLYGGRFAEQVEDTRARLDSLTVRLLQRFLKDGDWQEDKNRVSVRLKDNGRRLSFRKENGRWFMEHASK
ncbi:MAG TPA: hypothetical protein VN688_22450 [Gemmataceae bacterium]|nr:hypothetical protein [Gemmataceae bacterium]